MLADPRRRPSRDHADEGSSDLCLEVGAIAPNVRVVRHVLGGLAQLYGLPAERLDAVILAASEAVTNVVRHACPAGEGTIRIAVRREGEVVELRVRDRGVGLRPRPESQGLGVGIAAIAAVSESVELARRPDGGTEVVIRVSLAPPAGREPR